MPLICGFFSMAFGRLIKVRNRHGDPRAKVFVVAELDAAKAIEILKTAGIGRNEEFEDLGRASDTILEALALQPGKFIRA